MPHPNETLIRAGYAAFAAQDIPYLLSVWAPDLTWTESGHNALSGTHKGTDEVLSLLGRVGELTGGTFALDIDRVVADDNGAAVVCSTTASRDGTSYAFRSLHLWTVENGIITAFEEFNDDGRAADELFA